MVSKVFDSIGEWVIDNLKLGGECIKPWVCAVLSTNQCEQLVIKIMMGTGTRREKSENNYETYLTKW